MLGLEMVVVVGVALVLCGALAQRFPVQRPSRCWWSGALLGLVPALREVHLPPPEVVLLLFLPALLYWESLTTSLREIRSNLRGVVLPSTVLVVATAAAGRGRGHALGMAWGPAWVLGAAARADRRHGRRRPRPRAAPPHRHGAARGEPGQRRHRPGRLRPRRRHHRRRRDLGLCRLLALLLSYVGGALAGRSIAWLALRRGAGSTTPLWRTWRAGHPFAAFLLADLVHASGVLAVVVCGLLMSQTAPRITSAAARQQMVGFWSLATTVLNSALFLLVGLQAQSAVRSLTSTTLAAPWSTSWRSPRS